MIDEGRPQDEPGTYALLFRAEEEQTVEVGALGSMTVQPGQYVYVGSALGPGGVQARVRRHARGDGALHWHVDYLRAATVLDRVWWTHDDTRRECDWAAALRNRPDTTVPLSGFGASDCDCPAHLVRTEDASAALPNALAVETAEPVHAAPPAQLR